ncbi:hypothetical protein COMA2_130121 [Candidatus Nitrospira nitrificans]|uniref:Uncharacterized protein n=1 Tax=Candidatus Nitrospira nitrificans TaxID=1742973 RepID=A0A0S4LCF1_9BACT|nr:hypothetical protein COMA2_130121 [Candidatus Nitrospira nitrificans]
MAEPDCLQQIPEKEEDGRKRARPQYGTIMVESTAADDKPQHYEQSPEKEPEQQERKRRNLLKRGFGSGKGGAPNDGGQEKGKSRHM